MLIIWLIAFPLWNVSNMSTTWCVWSDCYLLPKEIAGACQTSWLRTDIGHGEQWLAMTWTQMSPSYTIYCVSVLCSYRYQRELREFIVHLFVRPSVKQMEIASTIFRTVWFYQKGREVVVSPVSVYYRMKL